MNIKTILIIVLSILLMIISISFGITIFRNKNTSFILNEYELQIDSLMNVNNNLKQNILEYTDSIKSLQKTVDLLYIDKEHLKDQLNKPIYSKNFTESVLRLKINLENEKDTTHNNF